jgi:MFS transporter, DHA1 family, multidrug resistance protein
MNISTPKTTKKLSFGEFVSLMAFMMSLVALSIDSMLPALSEIGKEFGIHGNETQLVVSLFFLGLAVGQIVYGPISDSTGRKPPIYAGFFIFIAGTIIAIYATSFYIVLAGRLLQGLGAAGPRTMTLSLVRDQYGGSVMARVMSFVMTVFILVPVIAPSMGQAVLLFWGWRSVFVVLLILAVINLIWFAARHPETLHEEYRGEFTLTWIGHAMGEFLSQKTAMAYTGVAGIIGGCFLGYLNSAQQLFQNLYQLGDNFPIFFAIIALSIGGASFTNAHFVMRFGMRKMAFVAMGFMSLLSVMLFFISSAFNGIPPFPVLMAFFVAIFFSLGILFGNLNALAMEPLGNIAGLGAAVVGFSSTLLQFVIGTIIGQLYNNTVLPVVGGFALLSLLSLIILQIIHTNSRRH